MRIYYKNYPLEQFQFLYCKSSTQFGVVLDTVWAIGTNLFNDSELTWKSKPNKLRVH